MFIVAIIAHEHFKKKITEHPWEWHSKEVNYTVPEKGQEKKHKSNSGKEGGTEKRGKNQVMEGREGGRR